MDMVSYHFRFTYAYGKYNTNCNINSIGNKIIMNMEEIIFLVSLPFLVFAIYLLLSDPDDDRGFFQKFHSMMKASRINKVVKMMGLKKSK
ncbi:MAG: hypothetical protein VXY93_08030 [Pseudomonadota bacterium]|nr:hypothetical protein [Pseudomonadota bacterium]